LGYADSLGTFATLTCPRPVTRDTALKKGKRFGRLLNERVFGKHFQRRKQGLFSVFTVEEGVKTGGRLVNPHLHYLIEKHPKVTPDSIKEVWATVSGRKAANLGIKVESIRSPKDLTRYILKEISWEHGPEVYIPKSSLRAVGEQ
jgi:hypothetical protein